MRDWSKGDENGLNSFSGRDDLFDDDGFFNRSSDKNYSVNYMVDCKNCGHSYDERESNYHCPVCGTDSMPF